MFWKKEKPEDKLRKQYEKLMKEAFDLSKTNRTASDAKYAEADEIMKKLESLSS
jgi:hypothetical protein